jgi:NAD(P)-dependent dehydrogenase (short-subunit alcohol dehydrogenase family)
VRVDGRVAVVTGGASGIGRGLVAELAGRGARVVAADVDQAALVDLAAELASHGLSPDAAERVVGVRTDVTDPASVDALRQAAVARFGQVDLVVLNAGVAPAAPLLETSLDAWRWVLDVNVLGVVHGLRTFVPDLVARGQGHVVVTASLAGLLPLPDLSAYVASKHAVVGLAETARLELAGTGVEVTILCPGGVRTGIFRSERNRPEALGGSVAEHEATQARLAGRVDDHGADPATFAVEVVDAIEAGRRWLLPDQVEAAPLRRRLDDLVSDAGAAVGSTASATDGRSGGPEDPS